MPFRDIFDPGQLAILTAVLDDICRADGIQPRSPEHEDLAALLLHFYSRGYDSPGALKAALSEAMREAPRSAKPSASRVAAQAG
jgi:hypothetical protein